MDPRKLVDIDTARHNVTHTPLPYWVLEDGLGKEEIHMRKKIVFFGNDMQGIVSLGIPREPYIRRVNECLDFIRNQFSGYQLYFKPHPAGKDEAELLDLRDFQVISEQITSEMLLWKQRRDIYRVFAINSMSTLSAYSMGLHAHVFYKYFSDIFDEKFMEQTDDIFPEMPDSFFIRHLRDKPIDNAPHLRKDNILETYIQRTLHTHTGTVWFLVSTTQYIVVMMTLAMLIRRLDPQRRIGLVISRHHRWDMVHLGDVGSYFNDVVVLPRIFYSLRLGRIGAALRTAWRVKQFPVGSEDLIISASQVEFVENCFLSYHKKNLRIGLIMRSDFNLHYSPLSRAYTENRDFRFSRGSWFFHYILEPMLGLYRSVFMYYAQGDGIYITRYRKPPNAIFDILYILDVPRG